MTALALCQRLTSANVAVTIHRTLTCGGGLKSQSARAPIKLEDWRVDTETRMCSRCGQTQSIDQFDARFIHKGTRLTCLHCRHDDDAVFTIRHDAWQSTSLQSERDRQAREEQKAAIEARLQQFDAELRAKGVDIQRRNHMHMQARRIGRRTIAKWEVVKQRFAALDPFYTIPVRSGIAQALRLKQSLFTSQQGLCYYCHVEMTPLDIPYKGSVEYRTAKRANQASYQVACRITNTEGSPHAREMAYAQWQSSQEYNQFKQLDDEWRRLRLLRADLEHIVPRSRGGADSNDNLALSCNGCNIRKGARTPTEFRQMPYDEVTRLLESAGMQLGDIARAIQYERENLYGFADVCCALRALGGVS